MRALIGLVVAIAMTITRVGSAQPADPLDEARALETTLDFERALVIVDREIERGVATTVARLVELHLLAGRLAAGIDHADIAEAHFARVLALAPDTRLADGTSPKLTQPFDAARAGSTPFHVELARVGARVVARVGSDPAHVFGGIRVRLESGELVVRATTFDIPSGRVATSAVAIDEFGNVVGDETAFAMPSPTAAPVVTRTTPIYARWTTWAIATAGALVVAGACTWRFESAQTEWNQLESTGGHDYTELAAVESRGRTWGIAADAGFGVAAAAGIAALVVLAVNRDDAGPRVSATGEAVGLSLAF